MFTWLGATHITQQVPGKAPKKEEKPAAWFELKVNTSVYVTGLPDDVTVEEIVEVSVEEIVEVTVEEVVEVTHACDRVA